MAGAREGKKPAAKKKVAKKAVAKTKKSVAKKTVASKKKAVPPPKIAAKKKTTTAASKKKAPPKKKKKKAASKSRAPKIAMATASEIQLESDPRPPPRIGSGTEPPPANEPTTERSPDGSGAPSSPTPSERVLATRAETPAERSLTDEEREAMSKVSETARRFVGAKGAPTEIVVSIASFLEEVRLGKRDEPKSQDVRLGLGVLWGEQLRAQVGWRWVHLTYPDGFASYALVPDDRAFACFPLNRVPEVLGGGGSNTSAHVFESIRENTLPTRKPNAYLVIG